MKPTPGSTQSAYAADARARSTLQHVLDSGGLVIAAERAKDGSSYHVVDSDNHSRVVARTKNPLGLENDLRNALFTGQAHKGRVVALCIDATVWHGQVVREVSESAPHVILPIRSTPTGLREQLAQMGAAEKVEPRMIGTDASVHRFFGGTTWAWVESCGTYRTYRSSQDIPIDAAETLAILMAARHYAPTTPLLIHTDSRSAIKYIRRLNGSGPACPAVIKEMSGTARLSESLRSLLFWASTELAHRPVEIVWVKGHDGHPLNEAADRLAVLARRAKDVDCNPEVFTRMCEGIVADMHVELRQPAA